MSTNNGLATGRNSVKGNNIQNKPTDQKKNFARSQSRTYDDALSEMLYESVDPKYVIPVEALAPSIPPRIPLEFEDDLEPCGGFLGNAIEKLWDLLNKFVKAMGNWFRISVTVTIWILVLAYMAFTIYKASEGGPIDWCNGYGLAFLLFAVILLSGLYCYLIKPYCLPHSGLITSWFQLPKTINSRLPTILLSIRYGVVVIVIIVFAWFVGTDTANERKRLSSVFGIVLIFLFALVFSKNPRHINWPTVLSGFALQLAIALLTVRWDFGRSVVECFANKVEHFLEFAYAGAAFAYGDLLVDKLKVFAFQSLSVLFFLSMVVQIMFYYGWIQAACFKVGSIIQAMLGTTICESVNAACIPFLGMSEAPLLYKPYITYLTPSELHAIMSGGFASCAGSLFAAYTALGVNPTNLITAASMAGPGSLYLSKLFYPENKKTKTSSDNIVLIKSFDDSVMSAACKGASSAVEMIQGIVANVIACVAFVAFLNGIVGWFGQLAGVQGLSFEYILGEVFIPLAWIMGVTPSQCEEIGRLIGLKTAVNEFVAYEELGKLKKAGRLTQRSEAIATFALCGFANPGSLSLMIATLGTLSPSQRSTVIDLSVRAFVCGSCTSFMAASLIGLLTPENGFA